MAKSSNGKKNNVSVGRSATRKKTKNKKHYSTKTKILTITAIVLCLVLIGIVVVTVIERFKESQPLAGKEGLLSADTNSYELVSGADEIDDKRDFTNDQIIEGQFTVLVLGFDESRELSDVMMLFLFDIHNKKLDILQIPRDSYVPDFTSDETGKLNSVYTSGDQSLIPIQRTVTTVRDLFGIPIDRYITTGCDDIVEIVDTLGGIPIDLPEDVFYSYDKILYAGEQVLNGEQAEIMVRARAGYNEGDIGRVKAQRIFMAACMEKALDMGTTELTSFIKKVFDKKLIATDMTPQELSILGDFASLIDMDDVTVQLVPGEGTDNEYGYSVWSIHKKATVDMLNKYFRPYQVDLNYDDLPIYELIKEGNYLTDAYDENQDTLQDIANGAKPGESKKKTSSPDGYLGSGNQNSSDDYSYEYDEYEDDYEYYDDYEDDVQQDPVSEPEVEPEPEQKPEDEGSIAADENSSLTPPADDGVNSAVGGVVE